MDDDGWTCSEGAEWDDTARTALLRKREQADAGDGETRDPGNPSNLGSALEEVSKAWRKRTQAQRLSAQRWIEQESHDPRRARWREELAEVLEATWTHVAIVVLLLVDLAATAIDILKTMHNKSHDLDVCVDMVESCRGCIEHFVRSEDWKWTYWTSIVILVILMSNVLGLMVAFGRSFFVHPLYVLDLVVVSTALGLEVLLDADTAGLIIVLTLWRIVRVAHGIFEVTDEAWEKSIKELETQVKGVQDAYEKAQEAVQEKNRELRENAHILKKLQAPPRACDMHDNGWTSNKGAKCDENERKAQLRKQKPTDVGYREMRAMLSYQSSILGSTVEVYKAWRRTTHILRLPAHTWIEQESLVPQTQSGLCY